MFRATVYETSRLDGYAWNNLADGSKAYEEAKKQEKSFIDLYDHTHIESNVREFLDYFVPRKVMAGNEFILKTCPRVIRSLLRWMRNKKLVDLTGLWRFFAVLRWFTQKTLQDGKIIAQFGRLLAGRL